MAKQTYKILVVEDEWINANYITQILETFGHTVVDAVSSSPEAIVCIQKEKIDLIFMDINIDGAQDGIALAHKINETSHIPIIYMTAFGDSDTIEEASETNIYGFIIKPFSERDVQAVLNVATQRLLQEYKRYQEEVASSSLIELGAHYIFDLTDSMLYLDKKRVSLSKNESSLLCLLCVNYGRIVSYQTIRREVWGDKQVGESTIRDTILRVRKKIFPLKLENIIGMGYTLQQEVI